MLVYDDDNEIMVIIIITILQYQILTIYLQSCKKNKTVTDDDTGKYQVKGEIFFFIFVLIKPLRCVCDALHCLFYLDTRFSSSRASQVLGMAAANPLDLNYFSFLDDIIELIFILYFFYYTNLLFQPELNLPKGDKTLCGPQAPVTDHQQKKSLTEL